MNKNEFDIIVVGAGPAGSTFTMALQKSGLKIALIDKAQFPRDKVCGDAIPGRAVQVLRQLSPAENQRFDAFTSKNCIRGGKAVAPNQQSFTIFYQGEGYTSSRMAFDYHLFLGAQKNPNTTILQNTSIKTIEVLQTGVEVTLDGKRQKLRADLIIGCDGAQSVVARQLLQKNVDHAHHCAAVRAYFRGVNLPRPDVMEIFLLKNYLPGYFWIFPLPDGLYNVGFGMLSADIVKKKIKLRTRFLQLIANEPSLNNYFSKATQVGKVEGFGLPLGSKKIPISGDRFMLTGDAASLIDPVTGEGIGNAMLSAKIAASHAQSCFESQRFDATFLQQYDQKLYRKLWPELRNKSLIQKLLKDRSWLINFCINQAANNPLIKRIVKKII